MPAFEARADEAVFDSDSQLTKTAMLDRFMPTLKGACPYHFVAEGTVVPEHFPKCGYSATLRDDTEYDLFKRSFQFERFSYCFSCGLPQDRNHNKEGPACHSNYTFTKSAPCPFAHFIFRASFLLWKKAETRSKMVEGLGIHEPISTIKEFSNWATKEERGGYHNCLEAFLWFCKEKEKENGLLFR